jgi:hypothetical protein
MPDANYFRRKGRRKSFYGIRAHLKNPSGIAGLRTSRRGVGLHRDISANIAASASWRHSFSLRLGPTKDF